MTDHAGATTVGGVRESVLNHEASAVVNDGLFLARFKEGF